MKKTVKLLLILSVVLMLTVSAFAIEWKFDGTTNPKDWEFNGMSATQESDGIKLNIVGVDIYMSYKLKPDEIFNASEYPYVAMVTKIDSVVNYGGFFFTTSTSADMGKNYTQFPVTNDGKWHGYVYNMSEMAPEGRWNGDVNVFRIDNINAADMNANISLNRIGIFKTKEEADAFIAQLPEDVEKPKESPAASLESVTNYDYASEEGISWIFDGTSPLDAWGFTGMKPEESAEGTKLTLKADDVFMNYKLPEGERFEASDYPYVSLVMKVDSVVNYGGFFFNTTTATDMGATYSNFGIKNDGEWHSYVIDMSKYPHGLWKGDLTVFRIDVINAADQSADITIERMGIFKTEKAAEAFAAKNPAIAQQKAAELEAALEKEAGYADMEAPQWIFDSLESVKEWSVGGANSVYRFGYLCLVPSTWDPILTYTFKEPFPASHFKYFTFRLRVKSIFKAGAFFFSNSVYSGFSDKSHMSYPLVDGEWVDIIVNMEEKFPERWVGEVNQIRLDPINGGSLDENAEIYLDRLGFFRTEEEAKAFLAEGRSEFDYSQASVIIKQMSKTYIPAGAIDAESFSESQFVIQESVDVNGKNDAIVMYVDKDGNESIVPLSYVNSAGFATFVGAKPGNYKIGYNTKEFVDTDGHWAKDYIKFVADRKLFGGTSPNEFSPEEAMTRGMFITVLGRMHGVDTSKYDGNTGYTDVASTEYYAPYIQWAKEQALMLPVSEKSFEPETPISRKDMALAAYNYMNAFGYDTKLLDESEVAAFNDLEGFSDAEKAAIVFVQRAGIINGKGEGKFDPYGVSTRAEVSTVMQRVVKSVLGVNILYSNNSYEYITRDRIRIGAWMYNPAMTNPDWFKTYIDAGFNMVAAMNMGGNAEKEALFDLADKYAIEMLSGSMSTRIDDRNANASSSVMNAAIYEHPSFNGAYLNDEPGTEEYAELSTLANQFIEEMDGRIPFINLLPMYANAAQLKYNAQAAAIEYYDPDPDLYRKYCDSFCEQFNTHYICVDIYPLFLNGRVKSTYKDYVESINQVASSARDHGKDFWCCIQAFGWNASKRTPNVNEYAWQCYTLLSFGCKGLIWWYYEGNANPSLINVATGETTQAYEDSKVVIAELNAISDTFVQYKNLGAFNVNYSASVPYLRMSNPYTSFDIISEVKTDDPMLVGCFEKKDGNGYAFTLVNMTELADEKTATVQVKLSRDAKVTSYQNGTPAVLTPENGYYTFTLDWGMGTFVTIE